MILQHLGGTECAVRCPGHTLIKVIAPKEQPKRGRQESTPSINKKHKRFDKVWTTTLLKKWGLNSDQVEQVMLGREMLQHANTSLDALAAQRRLSSALIHKVHFKPTVFINGRLPRSDGPSRLRLPATGHLRTPAEIKDGATERVTRNGR